MVLTVLLGFRHEVLGRARTLFNIFSFRRRMTPSWYTGLVPKRGREDRRVWTLPRHPMIMSSTKKCSSTPPLPKISLTSRIIGPRGTPKRVCGLFPSTSKCTSGDNYTDLYIQVTVIIPESRQWSPQIKCQYKGLQVYRETTNLLVQANTLT